MEIAPYEPSMAGELTNAYNHAVRHVPHCYPASPEDFASALAPAAGNADSPNQLHSQAAFVARDGRSVHGFIHVAIGSPDGPVKGQQGVIRFLSYRPGKRAAGQALLAAGEEHLSDCKVGYVQAFPQDCRYSFYHMHAAHLSDRLGHVVAILGFNGYRRIRGEVFFDWPDFEPVKPTPPETSADISVEWKEGRGTRPGLIVRARRGRKQIGTCGCVSGGEFSRAPQAQDWLFTDALAVEEPFQGKGLGRHLLRRALAEMKRIGYRHAAISTVWDNYRAFLFYSNFGYHVADWTCAYGRELK